MEERSGSQHPDDSPPNALAIEIARVARALANAETVDTAETLGHRLAQLLTLALAKRDDMAVENALALAQADSPGTFDVLHYRVHLVAQCPLVAVDARDPLRFYRATLFAVPVVLAPGTPVISGKLDVPNVHTNLCALLKASGLVPSGDDMIALVDYLYAPEELAALSPSDVYAWPSEILCQVLGERPKSAARLYQAPSGVSRSDNAGAVRYLVGIIVSPGTSAVPLEVTDENERSLALRADRWVAAATPMLAEAMGLDAEQLYLQEPCLFYSAVRLGTFGLREQALNLRTQATLSRCSAAPRAFGAIATILAAADAPSELRVSVVSRLTEEVLFGHTIPLNGFDDADLAANRIGEVLLNLGLSEVFVDSRIFATEYAHPSRYEATLLDGTPCPFAAIPSTWVRH